MHSHNSDIIEIVVIKTFFLSCFLPVVVSRLYNRFLSCPYGILFRISLPFCFQLTYFMSWEKCQNVTEYPLSKHELLLFIYFLSSVLTKAFLKTSTTHLAALIQRTNFRRYVHSVKRKTTAVFFRKELLVKLAARGHGLVPPKQSRSFPPSSLRSLCTERQIGLSNCFYFEFLSIIIIIRHELDLDRLVSASSNSLFKFLPSRLRQFGL